MPPADPGGHPPISRIRRSGLERFRSGERDLGFSLLEFWQWCYSDLVGNTDRGAIAEFLVAAALGGHGDLRNDWAPYDLITPSGKRVEVKSASFVQSWYQRQLSRVAFSIRPTRAWDPATNIIESEARRHADLYVFCLLGHADPATIDPLDTAQWQFFVLRTSILDEICPRNSSIGLERIRALGARECDYETLCETIGEEGQACP